MLRPLFKQFLGLQIKTDCVTTAQTIVESSWKLLYIIRIHYLQCTVSSPHRYRMGKTIAIASDFHGASSLAKAARMLGKSRMPILCEPQGLGMPKPFGDDPAPSGHMWPWALN